MYVMTEDNKILNLNPYVEIGIYPIDGTYKLQASYHKSRDDHVSPAPLKLATAGFLCWVSPLADASANSSASPSAMSTRTDPLSPISSLTNPL